MTSARFICPRCGAASEPIDSRELPAPVRCAGCDRVFLVDGCEAVGDRLGREATGEPCLQTLGRLEDEATCVAVSPNGSAVIAGCHDGSLTLWDVEFGQARRLVHSRNDAIGCVALSDDGRVALSGLERIYGEDDRLLRVWDTETTRCERVLAGHTDSVMGAALTPDGRLALSGSGDHTVRAWDVTTGRLIHRFDGHDGWVSGVAVSADGRVAVSAGEDGTMRTWDIHAGAGRSVLRGHQGAVWTVALSADGRLAVSGGEDRLVRIWDLPTGRSVRLLEGHQDRINSVALSRDGRWVAAGDGARHATPHTVRIWHAETGRCVQTQSLDAMVRGVALTADGRTLLAACSNGQVDRWQLAPRAQPPRSE